MGVFDNLLGNWIQIVDDQNLKTIEDYGYDTGVTEGTTENHCVKCTAANQCWFKNEKGKKPEPFEITKIQIIDTIINRLTPGLYHYRCHCQEKPTILDYINQIQLLISPGKINYLFSSKSDWVNAMGYYETDYQKFIDVLLQKTKEAYFYGWYYIEDLSKYGCKINLKIDIPGVNEKIGKVYKIESNYMIFPNKKLKCNTPIGGWQI